MFASLHRSGLVSVTRRAGVACLAVSTIYSAALLAAGGTFFTDVDNEDNAGTHVADNDMDRTIGSADAAHPIEFNVDVSSLPTTSAVLTVRALDVDEESGEQDDVYLNGVRLGALSGANNTWNSTAFTIDLAAHPNLLVPGDNLVEVRVDVGGDASVWTVRVDWAQLLIDGGAADRGNTGDVEITGYSIAGGTVTIDTQTTVNSVTGGQYQLEISIIAPNGDSASVLTETFTANPNETVILTASPTYPLGSVSGTYTVQTQLFFIDAGFPVQQDIATAQFEHTANVGPTDADNDGLTDTQEQTLGTDRFDSDTDGDGEGDAAEVGGDLNAPLDSDGDGINDALESSVTDSDGDGVANESDSANDNPCVPDAGAASCLAADSDSDGLTNGEEDTTGTDRNDSDSDGDGIGDAAEVGANPAAPTDSDADGIIDALESGATDTDGDGSADSSDADSDNDGILDGLESDAGVPRDTDGDGAPDHLDRDSDDDSLPDALEAGSGTAPSDFDGDGREDYLDLDSDNDGVADRLEVNSSGADSDGDGIDDTFDADTLGDADANGDGVSDSAALRDSNSDAAPDYLDVDSDGDGLLDSLEAMVSGNDSDADGIDDAMDPQSTGGADANGDLIDDAYVLPDSDGDGVPDILDLDSDNDGRSDVSEAILVDADQDSRADADQVPPATPADTDGDSTPDYLDVDSDGDGTFDVVAAGYDALDADHDGRIDNSADADGDGIADAIDAAPNVPGTFVDADHDGTADAQDLDLDNDGIPDALDGADDADGDGLPNLADLDSDNDGISDLIEGGGQDANGDGIVDTLTDANGNGLADGYDAAAGGTALPVPDSDHDGITDHRDLDSDGDGVSDRAESIADSDGDGIPDYRDQAGTLDTAVRGIGSFDWTWCFALTAFAAWRRRKQALALLLPLAALVTGSASADDVNDTVGMRVGVDAGISWLKPRNRDGGYSVDDEHSEGFRLMAGYTWSPRWSAEVFYGDAGSAGIASDNASVGHLGKVDYKMYGGGVEWAPLRSGSEARIYPLLKLGVVTIYNSTSDFRVQYDRQNSWGLYLGAGGAWRIAPKWTLQGELTSYDEDELMLTLGIRRRL